MLHALYLTLLLGLLPAGPATSAQDSLLKADRVQVSRTTVVKAAAFTSAYYAASLVVLGRTWYRGREVVPFHFYNDNRAYLQVDKLGHAFGAYVYSYAGYHFLRRAGLTRPEALLFGATLGALLQAPVEIMDGIHEGYGFSWGDMAANAVGSGVVLGQEVIFGEQVAKMKFSYRGSTYARDAHGLLGESALDRLFSDYNGHTYWISLPVDRLLPSGGVPAWLNMAIGYGADGMLGEFENLSAYEGWPLPEAVRARQILLSLDVDWTRIETDSRLLRVLLTGLTFVKLPFPAIEYRSTGGLKAHGVYF